MEAQNLIAPAAAGARARVTDGVRTLPGKFSTVIRSVDIVKQVNGYGSSERISGRLWMWLTTGPRYLGIYSSGMVTVCRLPRRDMGRAGPLLLRAGPSLLLRYHQPCGYRSTYPGRHGALGILEVAGSTVHRQLCESGWGPSWLVVFVI